MHPNRFRKFVMKSLWRIQQSQMVISIVFWSLTLTGIFYDRVAEKFNNFGLPKSNVFGGVAIMFMTVVILILLFGYLYDKFRFWDEQFIVMIERNPYASKGRMHPNQIVYWSAVVDLLPEESQTRKNLESIIQYNLSMPGVEDDVETMLRNAREM